MKEKVYFENSKGDKLCGILSNPSDDVSKPIMIICHGFGTSKDNKTGSELEAIFNEDSISTFRFDFYAHGESEGDFEDITLTEAIDDCLNAIKFLKNKGFSKIGLIGGSFGGMVSLIVASKINELFVLGLKCPVSDLLGNVISKHSKIKLSMWKLKGIVEYKKRFMLKYSFFEDAEKYNNPYKEYEKIKIPTIIVHGDEDESVPLEQSIKTSKAIKNCQLEIIKGADHYFSKQEDFEKTIELISKFIIENVKVTTRNP